MPTPRGANGGRGRPNAQINSAPRKRRALVVTMLASAAMASAAPLAVAQDVPDPDAATAPDAPPSTDDGLDGGADKGGAQEYPGPQDRGPSKVQAGGPSGDSASGGDDRRGGFSAEPEGDPSGGAADPGIVVPAQGDDQYGEDPVTPGNDPAPPANPPSGGGSVGSADTGSTGGSGGDTSGGSASRDDQVDSGATTAQPSTGGQLPMTGLDTGLMASVGAAFALFGLAIRRTLALR